MSEVNELHVQSDVWGMNTEAVKKEVVALSNDLDDTQMLLVVRSVQLNSEEVLRVQLEKLQGSTVISRLGQNWAS